MHHPISSKSVSNAKLYYWFLVNLGGKYSDEILIKVQKIRQVNIENSIMFRRGVQYFTARDFVKAWFTAFDVIDIFPFWCAHFLYNYRSFLVRDKGGATLLSIQLVFTKQWIYYCTKGDKVALRLLNIVRLMIVDDCG